MEASEGWVLSGACTCHHTEAAVCLRPMNIVNTSRRRPAPIKAMPANDSRAAVVTPLFPPNAPAPRVKLPGKAPVKFPLNVLVNVVTAPDGVPVTKRRDGFPMTIRTSPAAIKMILPTTSLLAKAYVILALKSG